MIYTILFQKNAWRCRIEAIGPKSAIISNAMQAMTAMNDYALYKSMGIDNEEDHICMLMQIIAREIFTYVTLSGPKTRNEEVMTWVKHRRLSYKLDGSTGFRLVDFTPVLIDFRLFSVTETGPTNDV